MTNTTDDVIEVMAELLYNNTGHAKSKCKLLAKAALSAFLEHPVMVKVREAALALTISVTYAPLGCLPNEAGQGYTAMVPEQFVIDLDKALAKLRTLMESVK